MPIKAWCILPRNLVRARRDLQLSELPSRAANREEPPGTEVRMRVVARRDTGARLLRRRPIADFKGPHVHRTHVTRGPVISARRAMIRCRSARGTGTAQDGPAITARLVTTFPSGVLRRLPTETLR